LLWDLAGADVPGRIVARKNIRRADAFCISAA
jgi:hypothetical protein